MLYKLVSFDATVTVNGTDYTASVIKEDIESNDEDFVDQCDDFDLQNELINQALEDNELDVDESTADINLDIQIGSAIEA